jgi:hypothetical protein
LEWLEELAEVEPFTHYWPQTGGGGVAEPYDRAYQGKIELHGSKLVVRIGECARNVGTEDEARGRLVVFFGQAPVCQFVDTIEGNGWASLIKPAGKKVLAFGEAAPPLYRHSHVEPYRSATGLEGRGIPKGMAVVIANDDLRSAVHHTGGRWLGQQGLPVRSA